MERSEIRDIAPRRGRSRNCASAIRAIRGSRAPGDRRRSMPSDSPRPNPEEKLPIRPQFPSVSEESRCPGPPLESHHQQRCRRARRQSRPRPRVSGTRRPWTRCWRPDKGEGRASPTTGPTASGKVIMAEEGPFWLHRPPSTTWTVPLGGGSPGKASWVGQVPSQVRRLGPESFFPTPGFRRLPGLHRSRPPASIAQERPCLDASRNLGRLCR